jgi:hypothetical protein
LKVELEMWHLFLTFFAFVSACWAMGSVLLKQFERRLDERFDLQEEHRREREATHDSQRRLELGNQDKRHQELDEGQRRLEREFLTFKAQLPDSYVRRDDYIRGQTVIEAKLDALAAGQSELRTLVAVHD